MIRKEVIETKTKSNYLEFTTINCDNKQINWKYKSKEEFIKAIDGDGLNVPMLDDAVVECEIDGDNSNGIGTVGNLYVYLTILVLDSCEF